MLLDNPQAEQLAGCKVLCGGEALAPDLAARLIERCGHVWNLYGPTETTIWSALHRLDAEHPEVLLGQGRAVEDLIDARHTHHDAEEDHDHDAFDSVAVDLQVADRQRLLAALAALTQRHEIYRVKGFVALPGAAMRLLVQGVGQRFDSHFDRPWGAAEARATRLVLIGDHLDAAALQAELQAQLDAVAA